MRKKTFFIFLAVLYPFLTGCDGNKVEVEPDGAPVVSEITVSTGTKTSISEDWVTSWTANDSLSVFVTRKSNAGNHIGHSLYKHKEGRKFTGTLDSKFAEPYNWFAVYPYSNYGTSMAVIPLSINHPTVQTQNGNNNEHISRANDPMFGYCLSTKAPFVQMHHVASVICFHVTNRTETPIKIIDLQFTAKEKISGTFQAEVDIVNDFTGWTPEWTASSSSYNTVELKVSNGSNIDKDATGDFYVSIHPFSATGDYTVKMTATSGGDLIEAVETVKNASLSLHAGKYKDINVEFADPVEVTIPADIENPALKAYLDKVEAKPYFTNDSFADWNKTNYNSTLMTTDLYGSNGKNNRFDQPVPVTLAWSGDATEVTVYSDKDMTATVTTVKTTKDGTADVYNLIPGHKYWYKVFNGSNVVTNGNFSVTGRRRMMKVCSGYADNYAVNCRDFGGLKTIDGKTVRYGLIYRGSNIDKFESNEEMRDVLLNVMGIKLDVDLRNDAQISSSSATDLTKYGITRDFQDYNYNNMNDLTDPKKVSATLEKIMESVCKDEPVYIHCRIGSDRTGYFCLLIEALIGVRQLWTDTDYELTSFTSSITGSRLRTEKTEGGKYKDGLNFLSSFTGNTLHDKVYDYVVTSDKDNALKMDKTLVDTFIAKMKQ